MTFINLEPGPVQTAEALDLNQQMILSSQGKYMLTFGSYRQFEIDLTESEPGSGQLTAMFRHELLEAQRSGVAQPVIAGFIPATTADKARFFIPLHWQFCSEQDIQQRLLDNSWLLPGVKSCQELSSALAEQQAQNSVDDFQLCSKLLKLETYSPVSKTTILEQLIRQQQAGYHFSLPLGNQRALMGSSAELLVRKKGLGIESNPVAGCCKRDKDPSVDKYRQAALLASAEDTSIHQLFSSLVKQKVMSWCSSVMMPEQPSLLAANNLWCLSSHIDGRLFDGKLNALELAAVLTAVLPIPGSTLVVAPLAKEQPDASEQGVFSGTVGWMNAEGDGEWITATESCTVSNQQALLYVAEKVLSSAPTTKALELNARLDFMLGIFGLSKCHSATLNPHKDTVL